MTFRWMLLLAAAATAVATIQTAMSIRGEADRGMPASLLRDVITNAACTELTGSFFMWNSSWWYWPEFKNGRIFRLGKEFREFGHCDIEMVDSDAAACDIDNAVLRLHYKFNVGVKNPDLDENLQQSRPLHIIEAGFMMALVSTGPIRMVLEKECELDHFLIKKIDIGQIKITRVFISNSTVTWEGKTLDTKDPVFQRRLRQHLAYVVDTYFKDMPSVKPLEALGRMMERHAPILPPESLGTLP